MKNLRSLFHRKQACAPLVNLQGSHVRKYRAFRVFLEHNHAALSAIADLEQAYYSGRPFSLSWAGARYEALWEAALGAVYALASLKGKPLSMLEAGLAGIDCLITEELTPRYAARSNELVLPFERIKGDAVHSTGAKAANLARIGNELALPVPPGFSVTTVATERFLSGNGLNDLIAKRLAQVSPDQPGAFERHGSDIRAAIITAAVPPDIAGEIMQAYRDLEKRTQPGVRVAVRSSAVGEDTEATFAGQYETVLNVVESGILEAYKQVLASKYSTRAVAYRLRYGLSDQETPMAVAVVAMIDPRAIWKGFTHPGVSWEGSIGLNMSKMLTLLSASATSEFGSVPGGTSYAILSGEYMNLSAKFGYHFATIDAFTGNNSGQNYVSLQFSGGAGSYYGKSLRIAFLGSVLGKLGFQVKLRGDLIEGTITDYDQSSLADKLDQMGRLLASSRLLDVALTSAADMERMTEAFFKADYDFLAFKRDEGPANFYTHGGSWKQTADNGRQVCMQDGSRAGFTLSSGVAGAMNKLVGQALQEFLDNVQAYYYFPLAVAKGVQLSDGVVRVRVKPVSGNIDRAGGIAFGMGDVSNYFVFRINALEDNAILFEFINGRRIERAIVREKIASGQWHDLRVEVRGRAMRCYLNDRAVLEYRADKPVQGYVGLWTKADSVTLFDGLVIETGSGTTKIAC